MRKRDHEPRPDERDPAGEQTGSTAPTPADARDPGGAEPATATGTGSPAEGVEPGRPEEPGWLVLIDDPGRFVTEWDRIETRFVEDPRRAVEHADRLVGEVVQALTDSLSETRSALQQQWSEGAQVGTEDLRLTLQRYRAFLNRLLPH